MRKLSLMSYGNYSDWIEIFNGDNKAVYLGDLYLTDNFSNPGKWQLPAISLDPGGFTLFWADGNSAPGTAIRRLNFQRKVKK